MSFDGMFDTLSLYCVRQLATNSSVHAILDCPESSGDNVECSSAGGPSNVNTWRLMASLFQTSYASLGVLSF